MRGRRTSPGTEFKGGSEHPSWKGGTAAYKAVHNWLSRHYPKTGVCEKCGGESREYANVSGEYHRDRSDYLELCVPCHRVFDNERRRRDSSRSQKPPARQAP